MVIYKDAITGDDIISDAWDLKLIDDVVYEANCKFVDVPNPNYDGDEDTPTTTQAIDVAHKYQLVEIPPMEKISYASWFKYYLMDTANKLRADGVNEADIKAFETAAKRHFGGPIIRNYARGFQQFVGKSYDPEGPSRSKTTPDLDPKNGLIILLNYREEELVTPYVTIWKHSVVEVKAEEAG